MTRLVVPLAVWSLTAIAQPAFEVATIKPGDPSSHGVQLALGPGGRFVAKNATARMLIAFAYDIRDHQVTGGPAWIDTDPYDIVAKPESGEKMDPDKVKLMVQSLLSDRFKLKFHYESKEMGVYALVPVKGGPQLKESAMPPSGRNGPRGPMMRMGRGEMNGQGVPVEFLAKTLSRQLGRTILDETGLKGSYDFTLHWTPEEGEMMGPKPAGTEPGPPPDASGPTIYTALQEQLGLKLESRRGPVEMYVIDNVARPTEN